MFKQLFQSLPVSFRVAWMFALVASIGVSCLIGWAIYRFVIAYT